MKPDVTNPNPKDVARPIESEGGQTRESEVLSPANVAPPPGGTFVAPLHAILGTQTGIAAQTGAESKRPRGAAAGKRAKSSSFDASLSDVSAPPDGDKKRKTFGDSFAEKFYAKDKKAHDIALKSDESEENANLERPSAPGSESLPDGSQPVCSAAQLNAAEIKIDDIDKALSDSGGAPDRRAWRQNGAGDPENGGGLRPKSAVGLPPVPKVGAAAAADKSSSQARFEGTNEVYIQSSAFDALCDAFEPPVVHAFEGTNEVYVHSSAFDALREGIASGEAEGDSSDSGNVRAIADAQHNSSGKIRVCGIKVNPPVLHRKTGFAPSDASNIIGIIGSGALPCVEIDKSFDMPVLDEGVMERTREQAAADSDEARPAPKKSDSLAVYASRMGMQLSASQQAASGSAPAAVPGLPSRTSVEEKACIHPENEPDSAAVRLSCARYAIDKAFDARFFDIFNARIDEKDTTQQTAIDRLTALLADAQDEPFARGVSIESVCSMTPYRILRRFLTHCADTVPNFSCYAPAIPSGDAPIDLVTALVASRLGCMPDDDEATKSETLIRNANLLFEPGDLRWGLDILFVRFGLSHLASKTRAGDAERLLACSPSDMRELFLNIAARDASQGPTVIVLPTRARGQENSWRDVCSWLRKQPMPNVLMIFAGDSIDWAKESCLNDEDGRTGGERIAGNIPDDEDGDGLTLRSEAARPAVETLTVPPLEAGEIGDLIGYALGARYASPECCKAIAEKCCGRFDLLRQLLLMFRNLGFFSKPESADNAGIIAQAGKIGATPEAVAHAHVLSFDEEMYNFLAWASMPDNAFYLQDLIQLMDLEPLPDEPIWSHPLRTTWCEEISKKCCRMGILAEMPSDGARGAKYRMIGRSQFCAEVTRLQPEFARQIRGCYAQMVSAGAAETPGVPARAAYHFEAAGMMLEAVQMRLRCARRFFERFENISAIGEIGFCLGHIGPENGSIYAEVLDFYAQICRRIGEFGTARAACLQCLAYEKFIRSGAGAVDSMIACGDILRIEGSYAEAQKYLLKAVELSEEIDDKLRISDAYVALSALVFEMGCKGALVNGLRYAEKALEIRRDAGDLAKIAEIQTLCARIYMMRGEPERARAAASEAYCGLTVSGCRHKMPPVLIVMAECAAALNDGLPLDYIERGFEIVRKTGETADRFNLLSMRACLMMTTLGRSQVRADMEELAGLVAAHPSARWRAEYFWLKARYDFSRKNFKKTTQSLRLFFDAAQRLGNTYLLSCGYDLSARLNLEVLRRKLGRASKEKTEKLHNAATSLFESVGAWHCVSESLRHYAEFLKYFKRSAEAQEALDRADKVDPYCQ